MRDPETLYHELRDYADMYPDAEPAADHARRMLTVYRLVDGPQRDYFGAAIEREWREHGPGQAAD